MHINFEDENIAVMNIQLFLQENWDKSVNPSGVYDTATHKALIQYLKQPNTLSSREMKKKLIRQFTLREVNPPHSLIDGGGIVNFDNTITLDTITFRTKPTVEYYNRGVQFLSEYEEKVDNYCRQFGWHVTDYTNNAFFDSAPDRHWGEITISKTGIVNKVPNREVLPMVNLFEGKYLYSRAFVDESAGYTDYIQPNTRYKIALVECQPGETFTIAHGYNTECEMAVGYVTDTRKDIRSRNTLTKVYEVLDRTATSTRGSVGIGKCMYYTVPEDSKATYLIIQMPFTTALTSSSTVSVKVKRGDINGDGIVDNTDVSLLQSYIEAIEQGLPAPFELSASGRTAANVTGDIDLNGDPIIDRKDLAVLKAAVDSAIQSGKNSADLGYVERIQPVSVSAYELDRLLVMYGEDNKDESLNIPVDRFYQEPWAVHSECLAYLFDRVIQPYSDQNDIIWLQNALHEVSTTYSPAKLGTYDNYDSYVLDKEIRLDKVANKWKYYVRGEYTGYYCLTVDNLQDCFLWNENGAISNMEIRNGYFYRAGIATHEYVLANGTIVSEGYLTSLKGTLKDFQLHRNEQIKLISADVQNTICWTYGYCNVRTERELRKMLAALDVTVEYGAFR